ncbi:MAG: YdbL family protein [Candidatus Abyssubacteria bacterium]|nr:YdbL family protein [Candidatus Abyssubacteria bacterium]
MRKSIFVVTVAALLLTLACVTVNVYFPAAEMQSAADRIEDEVRGQQSSSLGLETAPKESMLRRLLHGMTLEGRAYAQVDINVTTPNIRALIDSRAKRFEALRPLYEKGIIGESKDALLSIRSLDGLDFKSKAETKKLVTAENSDREKLYLEIVKANGLPPDTVSQIKEIFANSMRKKADKGWWIQKDDGKWVKKGSE